MEQIRNLLILIAFMAVSTGRSYAWRVVIDPNSIKVVSANLATQKLIEDLHNKRLDSIATRKSKLEMYSISMATIKELYKLSMENVKGFGPESKYYTEIGRCAYDILLDVPALVKTVSQAKFSNKVMCLSALTGLVLQTRQLVGDFVNIVNNAKITNPLRGEDAVEKKSDGYNMLDRYERLTLANRIYTDLMEIRYKVKGMMAMAQYATLNDLFFKIDPEGWAGIVSMRNYVDGLVSDWNTLKISGV